MAARRRTTKTKRKKRDSDNPLGRRQPRRLKGVTEIDFRDNNLLRRCVTEHGKIMPARFTGATAKQQRQIARAVRRARVMGFMS